MKKVLFVEDESALQEAVGEYLRQKGFSVLKAMDGETGARLAKQEKPDIILLDLVLPKKEGFEVLKELKEDDETKEIPIIVLTNLEGMGDIDKAMSSGATTYLVKTQYNLEEIFEKIKKIIGE
jgi:two-component system, OmpR family, phosphate regulon response regulator PhoB